MRGLALIILITTMIGLFGCSKGSEINGRSLRTANRSASYIKDRLPAEQRVEFEVSFWSIRDQIRNNKEFLDAIDGKSYEELIAMGKELFNQRKQEGFADYQQFDSWDQMIAHYAQQRLNQNRKADSGHRNQPTILYKM